MLKKVLIHYYRKNKAKMSINTKLINFINGIKSIDNKQKLFSKIHILNLQIQNSRLGRKI